MLRIIAYALSLTLAACATDSTVPVEIGEGEPTRWRAVATPEDRARVREWRPTFVAGLAAARTGGHAAALAGAGALLQPDAALPNPQPQVGLYRCRTIKLGRTGAIGAPYSAYPWNRCEIGIGTGGFSLAQLTGTQRPVGVLFSDTSRRLVFLGTLALTDETLALQYGSDPERNVVGLFERIDERRWRLVLPAPAFESRIDVIEFVPEGA